MASQSPHSQAAFRSPAGGIFCLWQKAPASFPPFSSLHWSQRALRSSLFFSNRVSAMLAGFLALGGFAGPVEALTARALMNWSFRDCRLLNPRYSTTSCSSHSQYSAQHSMQYQGTPNHLVPKPLFETQEPACIECAGKFQRRSLGANVGTRRNK